MLEVSTLPIVAGVNRRGATKRWSRLKNPRLAWGHAPPPRTRASTPLRFSDFPLLMLPRLLKIMRSETDVARIHAFMQALGHRVRGTGRIYLTGGSSAVLYGWRTTTIDLDLKADPEPAGFFEAIAELKETLDLNVELAAPDDFIPELPGWQERSVFIAREAALDFFHYDFYSQALAKIERGHERDLRDVEAMISRQLVRRDLLASFFAKIASALIRYPAIDLEVFRSGVIAVCADETHD